jgi:hypothetical protein
MGAIFAFSYLGNWLDENHPHPRVYYKILVLVGVALALYNVIRQVNENINAVILINIKKTAANVAMF